MNEIMRKEAKEGRDVSEQHFY
ncbi:hypothetical protein [Terrimonas pollutisoli]